MAYNNWNVLSNNFRGLKSEIWRHRDGHVPLKPGREDSPLPLPGFWWLLAILDAPYLAAKSLQSLSLSSPGVLLSCVCVFFHKDQNHTGLRTHPTRVWPHFPYFQIRSSSEVLEVRTSTHLFGAQNSTHNKWVNTWHKPDCRIMASPKQSLW